ncbi:hypothetical protein N866_03250 [Actinotalea ferrariae CF5-4]|uniref:Uncharacterized protein n=1 Tax=Actinotalea ferrariae CF5-4 TaxID=948458 RepID=A0A021VUT8_9CELL|nr:hypothetical protein N866_03250 [Actinotalea ferrariae CF5-4]
MQVADATQTGTALIPAGADQAMAVKTQMAASRAVVANARKAALEAQAKAKELIAAQQRALEAQLRAMAAELEPLQAQVRMFEEGIWTMNLYLGRDEELHTLAEGTPASAGTPIHVRQQVLAMDEESALYAEHGGMDVRDIAAFDQWITADPAHLDQVLPEQRGVVAIIPRRQGREYKDPWLQSAMDQANTETWWLIRNGQNVYRMLTDFNVGRRLVPARNEFTAMFVDPYTKAPLQPGTDAWLKAEKAAGARERHYMRIALILQGLIDRTAVFHPLPVAGLSLLSPEHYDAGHVVLIADDEHTLTTGRKPFYQWLAEKNRQLTPGMRVIITTRHQDWPKASRDRWSYGQHERLHPNGVENPPTGEVHTITRRGDAPGSLVFTYARTVETWARDERGRHELRVPKTKASCTIYPDDRFVLPVDLVTVEEMREYLAARTERHAYADLFPVLNAAIAFKEAEAAAEAPFRAFLAGQVAQAEDIDLAAAEAAVVPLVDWWKLGNRWHRPLNGDPTAEAKAAKAILAERARVARAAGNAGRDGQVVAAVRAAHPDVLLVARKKDGTYVALTPTPRRWVRPTDKARNHYGDQVAPLDVWVNRHEYTATGRAKTTTEWVIPAPSTVSRWIPLFEAERWASWNRRAVAADHLTDAEIADAAEELASVHTPDGWVAVAVTYQESATRHSDRDGFSVYAYRPGFTPAEPERAVTGERESAPVGYFTAEWKRERDGSIALEVSGTRSMLSSRRWSTDKPYSDRGAGEHFAKRDDGQLTPPWGSDRAAWYVVRLDEDAYDAAHAQALAERSVAVKVEALTTTTRELARSLAEQWVERATAEAKARFVEDYLDDSLWEDHAKGVTIRCPWWGSPRDGYAGVDGALHYLTGRLVESGRHPFGLTVAQAVAALGEPVLDRPDHGWSSGREVTLPEDVLTLRYPAPPSNAGLLGAGA